MATIVDRFRGGEDHLFASGAAFYITVTCLIALSLLSIALGGTLLSLHDSKTGCELTEEEWLMKFGWSGVGIGIVFLLVGSIAWGVNVKWSSGLSQSMSLSASS